MDGHNLFSECIQSPFFLDSAHFTHITVRCQCGCSLRGCLVILFIPGSGTTYCCLLSYIQVIAECWQKRTLKKKNKKN
ncbi:hypothetical protein GDO86_000161 [Hymenochirus boettgeri]|uniref:Uncharacterized protein n=1 Tax=Hymenochirus boettgeri TaxID=247094 RepID=A0A8T2K896_9PIPI|nr:hypothetical protein GDO86_000161 [Hymenochirus boettgeri]